MRVRVSEGAMRKGTRTDGKPKTVRLRACKPSSEQSAACVWWCSQPSTHAPQCRPHSAKDVCRALCAGNERTKKKHRHSHACCVLCAAATRVRNLLMAMLPPTRMIYAQRERHCAVAPHTHPPPRTSGPASYHGRLWFEASAAKVEGGWNQVENVLNIRLRLCSAVRASGVNILKRLLSRAQHTASLLE